MNSYEVKNKARSTNAPWNNKRDVQIFQGWTACFSHNQHRLKNSCPICLAS